MKYRAALFSSAFCLVFVTAFFVGSFVWADQYGLEATASAADLVKETSVPNIIGNVIGAGLSLVTVLFFILMIYAGIKWMLSRGDEGKAKEALDTIIAAIIGIVVVLAAYAITNFVFKSVGEGGGSPAGGSAAAGASVCTRAIDTELDILKGIETFCNSYNNNKSGCEAAEFYGQKQFCSYDSAKSVCYQNAGGKIEETKMEGICNSLAAGECEKTLQTIKFCKKI